VRKGCDRDEAESPTCAGCDMQLMRLPWDGRRVPHGTLDILRECNIACRSCYNCRPNSVKPYQQVVDDFEGMLAKRCLHTVTLTGGEVTLHPDLTRIVRHVRSRGVKVAIVTNGVLIDSHRVSELKMAGANLIMLHIQQDQRRPDLPEDASLDDIQELCRRKLEIIDSHGVETGLSYTVYHDRFDELTALVRFVLGSRHANFVLFTLCSSFDRYAGLRGSLEAGFRTPAPPTPETLVRGQEEATADSLLHVLEELNITPYAYVGGHDDLNRKMWYAFLCATLINGHGAPVYGSLKSSLFERTMIRLSLAARGHTPFLFKPGTLYFQAQLLLNGLLGGDLRSNLRLFAGSLRRGVTLQDKHFLVQRGPELKPNGDVIFCKDCPDATIRDGKLYPLCLADRIVD